ncbi:MAG: PilZ domain-containing protein [Gammaproteobacteria bacterium]|nr:PilZ domain-containing protein [Gammaproteobacteria bacterium]MCW8986956.1 PilZ domain-containing protein [Gammaproteobacteria bacterium]MCW9031866.1 PilZ domain-containing protein [Gammaproteobacteria bacterium]
MNRQNKRKHRRSLFSRDIILDSVDGKQSLIKSNDISTSGMGLYADMPRIKGELLRLKFELIQNGKKREVNIAGEVKHVQLAEHGYNFGVRFI